MEEQFAVFIDADNVSYDFVNAVIEDISKKGRIILKRAFANWSKPSMTKWVGNKRSKNGGVLVDNLIKPIYQIDYTTKKNASDISLVINVLDFFYTNTSCNNYVIVSGDSDFTPLVERIRESGKRVYGYGNVNVSDSFRNSCDEFKCLLDLKPVKVDNKKTSFWESQNDSAKHQSKSAVKEQPSLAKLTRQSESKPQRTIKKVSGGKILGGIDYALTANDSIVNLSEDSSGCDRVLELNTLDRQLEKFWRIHKDEKGFANVNTSGMSCRKNIADFNIEDYGAKSFPDYVKKNGDKYEFAEMQGKGKAKINMYRIKF